MEFKDLAEKLGLVYDERRLGYHLKNNPNRLMKNGVQFVTIHQTGSPSYGADAISHHNYQRNGSGGREVSWHWTVDEKIAIQSFRDTRVTWHSADSVGNETSISIELCIDADVKGGDIMGETNYKKTIENGAKLTAIKLFEYGLSIDKIKQHNNWNGKNCPAQLRAGLYGVKWADFVAMVKKYLDQLTEKPEAQTQTPAPDGKLFRVAVDSFKFRENADDLIKQLKADGYNAFLVVIDDPRGV